MKTLALALLTITSLLCACGEVTAQDPDANVNQVDSSSPSPDASTAIDATVDAGLVDAHVADGGRDIDSGSPATDGGSATCTDYIVAFERSMTRDQQEIWRMNPAGGELMNITDNGIVNLLMDWSPDATKISFRRRNSIEDDPNSFYDVYTIAVDASSAAINLTRTQFRDDEGGVFSPSGATIAVGMRQNGEVGTFIWQVTPDGNDAVRVSNAEVLRGGMDWSPSGQTIAFVRTSGALMSVAQNGFQEKPLTPTNSGSFFDPQWSPDGTQILFTGVVGGIRDLYVVNADGTDFRNLTRSSGADAWGRWSPDGNTIVFQRVSAPGQPAQIFSMRSSGAEQLNLTQTSTAESSPAWSPRGDFIFFVSTRDGNPEIYKMDPDGGSPTNLTNSALAESNPLPSPCVTR